MTTLSAVRSIGTAATTPLSWGGWLRALLPVRKARPAYPQDWKLELTQAEVDADLWYGRD